MNMLALDGVAFGEDVVLPIVAVFCIFGLPVLAFVFFRVMAHRERMEMIRNGFAPGTQIPKNFRSAVPPPQSDAAQTMLRKGITLTFIGLAITIGLSFIGYNSEMVRMPGGVSVPMTTWTPGPWLLGGLVPMFVGLAQVVSALLSGATLRPIVRSSSAPYAGDAPYTYRPGDTQELRPPRTPPERRP